MLLYSSNNKSFIGLFKLLIISLFLTIVLTIEQVSSSNGDGSVVFSNCLYKCRRDNCSNVKHKKTKENVTDDDINDSSVDFYDRQPLYLRLLGWDCDEECKYDCMWFTIHVFVYTYGYEVPQFYGKWPFIRILGLQEPASVLASILNLLANFYMFKKLNKCLKSKRKNPFRTLWYTLSLISMNTWVWSAIFHAKETPFTERMDYFCAFGFVLFQFNSFFVRFFKVSRIPMSDLIIFSISTACISYFVYHCYYLSSVSFDYGYNMKMNILFGAFNSICWIFWSIYNFYFKGLRHAWRCAFSVLIFDVSMIFEIFDFSPIWWTLDSHAAWHFSTIIIPFYWYQFLIDDINYIHFKHSYSKI